ncbi:Na(+)/H(+) antiporter subunit B [Pseudogracilibacillus auburnensis]|uniref:Multisubunit sodium/proton antiporter MrpB subunit n=1 Tax=Pseudogracilibacillus auburnensis TaxID=1494959 RepID=A0A2V3W181_9BACI|nr:Na(+)/H(+) antiporter subunit B [Pseudogracilibacillus auburnensis]MBO1002199.1 Na(+)/H(+) antiporter subunit B [Pseudogracilibacillus auburnensis]PXW87526.1 multisubunit sodium/proton antiporter MrpB subunit [Pseudogracilibacillus auburnensis]
MKINEVILQSVSKIVVFIILTLALYLFFAGHNAPGGGFIGGLVLASSFVLMLLAFDIETVKKGIPVDFKLVAASGALIVLLSGLGATILGEPFLSQSFAYFDLPFYGEVELTTVTIFETGVALAVVGVVVTIILSISEDV